MNDPVCRPPRARGRFQGAGSQRGRLHLTCKSVHGVFRQASALNEAHRPSMLTSPLNSARGRPAAPVGGDPLLHPKGGVVKLEMMQKQLLRAEAAAEMESAVCRGDLAAFETRLDHWRGVRPQMTMSSRRSIMLSMPDPDVTRPARIVPIMFSASR